MKQPCASGFDLNQDSGCNIDLNLILTLYQVVWQVLLIEKFDLKLNPKLQFNLMKILIFCKSKSRSRYMSNLIKYCLCHSKICKQQHLIKNNFSKNHITHEPCKRDLATRILQKEPCKRNLEKGTLEKEP
jgi:hypothetical protein